MLVWKQTICLILTTHVLFEWAVQFPTPYENESVVRQYNAEDYQLLSDCIYEHASFLPLALRL